MQLVLRAALLPLSSALLLAAPPLLLLVVEARRRRKLQSPCTSAQVMATQARCAHMRMHSHKRMHPTRLNVVLAPATHSR
jgi:hypothetical protein